jgi:WD40 repeat protein
MIKLAELETIFLAALETESPEQRAALLDRACADQPAARRDLIRMLAAHARLGDFLDQPAIAHLPVSERDLAFLQPPTKAGSLGRLAHYEILEVIGRGGCGIVLKASDEKLQRIVAIKAMTFPWTASSTARKRFMREARAAAAISHDNIVPIHAVEEEDGVPYLVMQYVSGETLEDKLRTGGTLGPEEVLRIGVQIAEGLAAAHAQGIVHRDIKPGNILLEENTGRVKITDFGLAQAVDDASAGIERIIAGTPDYMAPEQARGEAIDHRADLFSFGCVLYRLCTGKLPFKDAKSSARGWSPAAGNPAPPGQLNPDVPPALSDLIMRLLALDPNDRRQSAREVAEALRAIDLAKPHPARSRKLGGNATHTAAVLFVLVFGAGGYWFGPTVYRLATNQGQLVIESDDPDVKVVIKQQDQEVLVIDLKTQQEVTLKAGPYQLGLSEAKYGLKLAAKDFTLDRGDTQIVRVRWELAAAKNPAEVLRLVGHKNYVNAAAFCLDGTRVISGGGSLIEDGEWVEGSDFSVRLWDAKTGRAVAQLLDHTAKVMCLAVSPDGKFAVSAGQDSVIRLWDLQAQKLVRRFDRRHSDRINEVAFTADGKRVVSASWDKTVRIWDVQSGAETGRCDEGETVDVWGVAVSRDGKQILTGNKLGLLRLWNAESGKLIKNFRTGRNGAIGWISLSPDGRFALSAGVIGGTTLPVVWNLESGKPAHAFRGHTLWLGGMTFSPDGSRILTSSADKTVRLWEVATEEELARFEGHENAITTVAFSPDGRFAVSASWDKTVRIWKLPE